MEKIQEIKLKEKLAHIRQLLDSDLDKAASELQEIDPKVLSQDLQYEYYYLAGNVHYEKDETDDAILCYNLVLKNPRLEDKDMVKVFANLSGAYFDKKLYKNAIFNTEKVIQFSQDKKVIGRVLKIAGLAYQNLDNFKDAIRQFLKILEIYDEKRTNEWTAYMVDSAYSSLAINYWQSGDDALAEKYCNKLFSLKDPDSRALFWAHICKAHRLYEKQLWNQALEHYNKAMELAEDDEEKQFYKKYIIECLERMPK